MVTIEDVEVHIVSSSDGRELVEFDNPKAIASTDNYSSERFIEAITYQAYHIEVRLKPSFKLYAADGIKIKLYVDGGTVNKSQFYDRNSVEKKQRTGSPMNCSTATFREGALWQKVKFSFGSLEIDENLEIEKEILDQQASTLGCINVSVYRVTRKDLLNPIERERIYTRRRRQIPGMLATEGSSHGL